MIVNLIDIDEWIKNRLVSNEERYLHSLGTKQAAISLAETFGEDIRKAALAGLIHDNAKCYDYDNLVKIAGVNKFPIEESIKNNPKVLHAYAGAYFAQKELDIQDKDILNSIMYHTTGRLSMSRLEKIIYIADKIESNTRPKEYREKIIKVLDETKSLDRAIFITLDMTIRSLLDRKLQINVQTIDLWNYLAKEHN